MPTDAPLSPAPNDDEIDDDELVLGDLLNHVLDKGVVISGTVTISVADIDLLVLDLRLLLTSVETSLRRGIKRETDGLIGGSSHGGDT
ncbi:MAG TPA: gas vesicle protein GvpJ [Gemmatimonadaceae bacterium]|nr:gas vesicle protein GvpJ [Gemmatimonadaceae bacterium]